MSEVPITRFEPALTASQYQKAMENMGSQHRAYRAAMFSLTQGSDKLAECVSTEEGAEDFYSLLEAIQSYQEWRKADDELVQAAYHRIMLVLCEAHGLFDDEPEARREADRQAQPA